MSDITVIFTNQPAIHIDLYPTTAAQQWKQLFTINYQRKFPIFRDMQKYTWEYLEQLIEQANQTCGWNYTSRVETLEDTVALHKNIETTLAKGYINIPESWDHLLDELHFALHKIEHGRMTHRPHRGNFLQIEWFNDDFVPLPDDFEFSDQFRFGSLRLQNAYVGHPPTMIYQQNDHTNVFQTCRFHDRIKPGLHIMTSRPRTDGQPREFVYEDYYQWWHTNAPDFVAQHGWERIMYYSGYPLIGHVVNVDDLETVNNHPEVLELQEVIIN